MTITTQNTTYQVRQLDHATLTCEIKGNKKYCPTWTPVRLWERPIVGRRMGWSYRTRPEGLKRDVVTTVVKEIH